MLIGVEYLTVLCVKSFLNTVTKLVGDHVSHTAGSIDMPREANDGRADHELLSQEVAGHAEFADNTLQLPRLFID